MKRSARSIGAAGLLLLVGTLLGVAAAEAALRITHLAPAKGLHTVDAAEFEAVPGLFSPGQRLVDWRNRSLPHPVTINALGYRGAEMTREKPPGELRIVVVGDSFVYGDFVDDAATLPALLEQELAGTCRAVRVVNAGVPGTTIVTHAAMVARAGVLTPDVVLLVFYEYDVRDLLDPLWPQLEWNRERKSRFPVSVVYRTVRDMAIWNFAQRIRASLRARRIPPPPPSSPDEPRDEYVRLLLALRDSLQLERVPLVVTAFPDHNTVYRDSVPERLQWFAGMLAAESIPYIDVFSAMVASGRELTDLYLMPHDGHASPEGNRLAARTIARELAGRPEMAGHCEGAAVPSPAGSDTVPGP